MKDNKQNIADLDEIRIIVKGKFTIAKDLDGNVGIARCNPADKFNTATGVELAMGRLKLAQDKKYFKPYVADKDGEFLGYIGEYTGYRDVFGTKICVGDTVKIGNKSLYSIVFKKKNYYFVANPADTRINKDLSMVVVVKQKTTARCHLVETYDEHINSRLSRKTPFEILTKALQEAEKMTKHFKGIK